MKIKKKVLQKIISSFSAFILLLNSFVPYFSAVAVYAQSAGLQSNIAFDSGKNSFQISINTNEKLSYLLAYKTPNNIEGTAPTTVEKSDSDFSKEIYAGIKSGNDARKDEVVRGIYKIKVDSQNWFNEKKFVFENGSLKVVDDVNAGSLEVSAEDTNWLETGTDTVEQICADSSINNNTYIDWNIDLQTGIAETKDKVQPGVTYVFPLENKVTVKFNCLPKNEALRTSLKIQQVKVSDLKLPESVNPATEFAYDITTGMKDGTFKYEVTLPKLENQEAKVSYIEKKVEEVKTQTVAQDQIKTTDEAKTSQETTQVKVTDLDHFTIFFTTDSSYSTATLKTDYLQGESINIKADNLNGSYYYKFYLNPPSASAFGIGSCTWGGGSHTITATYDLVSPNNITPGSWTVELYRFSDSNCTNNKHDVQDWPEFEVHSTTCDSTTIYEKTGDFSNSQVAIDFSSNDDVISVSAATGYQVTKVWLDLHGDGHGYLDGFTLPLLNFNPPGNHEIDKVKVELKRICAVCGNNIFETGEVCDGDSQTCTTTSGYTGNQNCNATCDGWDTCTSSLQCGDGTLTNPPETCDDGANNGEYGYCKVDCSGLGPHCGDGVKDTPHEQCDDGNITNGDGCSSTCQTEAPTCPNLFFSEYIEGSSENKALEIYNPTGSTVNLTSGGYKVEMYFNGSSSPGLTISLSGSVAADDVFVLARNNANATILAQADQIDSGSTGWYNGNDAVVLKKGNVIIDAIGKIGQNPGSEWGAGLTSTADNTLTRKCGTTCGDFDATDSFDPSVNWNGYSVNTFSYLGNHTPACPAVCGDNVKNGTDECDGTDGVPNSEFTCTADCKLQLVDDKITICHSTSSQNNPYVINTPNKSGDLSGHADHLGPIWYPGAPVNSWGDIIPPFWYFDNGWQHFDGLNWTDGQTIWDNGCKIPSKSTVTVCKKDQSGAGLSGWQVILRYEDPVESINVAPNGTLFSSSTLAAADYILRAEGTYTYRPNSPGAEYTDANFSKRLSSDSVYGGAYVPWVNVNSFPSPYTGWLGIMVNGTATNWNDVYNPSHIYALGYPGYSGNFTFQILDDQYSDNSGNIPVGVYNGWTKVTGENGCTTFTDVPYGTYYLEEILQNNWVNDSGMGQVIIDSNTENFTLVNHEMPKKGKITIKKTISSTDNSDSSVSFQFELTKVGDTLPTATVNVSKNSPQTIDVDSGTYSLTEVIPDSISDKWIQRSATCTNSSDPTHLITNLNSIVVNPGDTVECTQGNEKKAEIWWYKIDKNLLPSDSVAGHILAADTWESQLDSSTGPKNTDISTVTAFNNPDTYNNAYVTAGRHSLEEVIQTGWDFAWGRCQDSTNAVASGWGSNVDTDQDLEGNQQVFGPKAPTSSSDFGPLNTSPKKYADLDLQPGQRVYCVLYNEQAGSISGHKWEDLNGDGVWDNDEPVVDGTITPVKIFVDTNGNGQYDGLPNEYYATIDNLGRYSFGGLVAGSYNICEKDDELTGWLRTFPKTSNCQTISVSSNQDSIANFGNIHKGKVTVYKFEDLNKNGFYDNDEPLLPDWDIIMGQVEGTSEAKKTDEFGKASFELNPDDYILSENIQDGWKQTGIYCGTQEDRQLITSPGEAYGHHGACQGWNSCGDAATCAQWACEVKGYSYLASYGDQKPCTQFDNCNLFYSRGSVQYNWGNWCDVMGVTDIYCSNKPIDSDNSHEVKVLAGDQTTCYIGNIHYGKVNVTKYHDLNQDGIRQETEPVLSGWDITLNDNTKTTPTDGQVLFEDLSSTNSYFLSETIQGGWKQTNISCGKEEGIDNDNSHQVTVNAGETTYCEIGNYQIPRLSILKYNNKWPFNATLGGEVVFTIVLHIFDNNIKDLHVFDLLPNGFKYKGGTWQALINGSPVSIPEPEYHSPGDWQVGDVSKDDEITLQYTATIDPNQEPGLYKDLAFAYGCESTNTCTPGEDDVVLASSVDSGKTDPGVITDNHVGTKVNLVKEQQDTSSVNVKKEEKREETGEVLGASTGLPATGGKTIWLLISTILSLLGIISLAFGIALKSKKVKFMKNIFAAIFVSLGFLIFGHLPVQAVNNIDYLSIRLEQPQSPTRLNSFKLVFVTMDMLNQPITVKCFKNGVQFGSDIAVIAGGNTGSCQVNSSVINSKGTYSFYATATTASDSVQSETVTVDYNTEGPGTPSSYSKEHSLSCQYKIKFKTSDDGGKTTKVEVYRNLNTSFGLDPSNRVASISIGSNTDYTYIDNVPSDCDKEWYYAVRAFDAYGNGSGWVGDSVVTVTTVTSSTTTTTSTTTTGTGQTVGGGAIPVVNVTLPSAEVLGAKTTPTPKLSQEKSSVEESVVNVLGAATKKENRQKLLLLGIGLLALVIIGYVIYKKKRA